jgi:hypothetical protein
VAHGAPLEGNEPAMREYFVERARPLMERALREGNHRDWPLITLNLDVKRKSPNTLKPFWRLLSEYQTWLTTALKSGDEAMVAKGKRPSADCKYQAEEQRVDQGHRNVTLQPKMRSNSMLLISIHIPLFELIQLPVEA